MTKVSIFMQDFSGGGAEKMMVNLANEFYRLEGVHLDLIVVRKHGPNLELLDPEIPVIETKAKRVLGAIGELARYMRRAKPDGMLTTLKHVNIAAIIAKRISGSKCNVVIREACHFVYNKKSPLRQKLAYFLVPFFYRRADRIIAVSEGVKESVLLKVPNYDRIITIRNPVLNDKILRKYKEKLESIAPFNEKDSKIIVSSGRLENQKDYESLIRALSGVQKVIPGVKLCILGKGSEKEKLQKLARELGIADGVFFLGFQANPYKFLAHADLFVLSSRHEGSPNVIVEALAAGLPVVSTDCPSGPREILEDGKYGVLVRVGDVQGLERAMIRCLSEDIFDSLSQKDRARSYRADQVAVQYLNALIN